MTAKFYTDNTLSIDGRDVGKLKAVTDRGEIQNATASKPQVKAQFRPIIAPATIGNPIPTYGDPILIDAPIYVSRTPSDHELNPALIAAIREIIRK